MKHADVRDRGEVHQRDRRVQMRADVLENRGHAVARDVAPLRKPTVAEDGMLAHEMRLQCRAQHLAVDAPAGMPA